MKILSERVADLAEAVGGAVKDVGDRLTAEIAGRTSADAEMLTAVNANTDAIADHVADTVVHVTADERTAWNAKADASALDAEVQARTDADATLTQAVAGKADASALTAEAEAREEADETLAGRIRGKQDALTFDSTPTEGSTNPVTSGGVKTAIDSAMTAEVAERENMDQALYNLISVIQAPDVSTLVPKAGDRGAMAGYESASAPATAINASSPDSGSITAYVSVNNGTAGTSWFKAYTLKAVPAVTLGTAWSWRGGEAPTLAVGGVVLFAWVDTVGIAQYIEGDA